MKESTMGNSNWLVKVDLTGVKPLGVPFEFLDEGGYGVIVDSITEEAKKAPKVGTNLVPVVRIKATEHRGGEERRLFIARPEPGDTSGKATEMFKRNLASLFVSCGYPEEALQGTLDVGPSFFVGREAYIYASAVEEEPVQDPITGITRIRKNQDLRFISVQQYSNAKAVDRLKASNGASGHATFALQVPALATGIVQTGLVTAPTATVAGNPGAALAAMMARPGL